MSLINQALVTISQNALMGATWAEGLVFAQPIDPIGEVLRAEGEAQKPVLAVFVETADFDTENMQTQGAAANVDFKVFVYVAPGRVDIPDGFEFTLDSHSAGLTLNLMNRQVDHVLFHTEGPWQKVWKMFVKRVISRKIRYILVEIENGVRVPTCEITYSALTSPDPNFGEPMKPGWVALDAQLRTTTEGAKLADLFRGMIEGAGGLPDYQILKNTFGLSDASLAATGLAPFDPASVVPPNGAIPLLDAVTTAGQVDIGPKDD